MTNNTYIKRIIKFDIYNVLSTNILNIYQYRMLANMIIDELKKIYIEKINPERLIKSMPLPKEIKYFTSKYSGGNNDDKLKLVYNVFTSMKLLDVDDFLDREYDSSAQDKKIEKLTKFDKCETLITCLNEEYYDGVYFSNIDKFKFQKQTVMPCGNICNFVIKSPKKLNKVSIENNPHQKHNIVINDNTIETVNNNIYEYRFIYDGGRPYMQFPECLISNNMGDQLYIVIDCDDPNIEIILEYVFICPTITHRFNTINYIYNIIPTNKSQVFAAIGMGWLPSIIFNYPNNYFRLSHMDTLEPLKTQYVRDTFKDIIYKNSGCDDMIKITSIKYFTGLDRQGFNIYAEPLHIEEVCLMNNKYSIKNHKIAYAEHANKQNIIDTEYTNKLDRYLCINDEIIAVQKENYKIESPDRNVCISISTVHPTSFGIGILEENIKDLEEIKLDYPLYILKGTFCDKSFLYTLVNDGALQFCVNEDNLSIKWNQETIWTKENTSKWSLYKKQFKEPYSKICVGYKRDCIKPDMNWFMVDNKCYVYWNGAEYLTMPPFAHYVVPTQYEQQTIKKLELEGYSINCHC